MICFMGLFLRHSPDFTCGLLTMVHPRRPGFKVISWQAESTRFFWRCSFRNYAAGDPRSGVARRVGHVVVRAGVNHNRRAALVEERVRTVAHRHLFVDDLGCTRPIRPYLNIFHVSGVRPIRVFESVLLVVGIEVRARRLEVGAFALAHVVNVERVLS